MLVIFDLYIIYLIGEVAFYFIRTLSALVP